MSIYTLQSQGAAAPGVPQLQHTFTLVFSDGAVAVLDLFGIDDQDIARLLAYMVLPPECFYEVIDGDQSKKFGGAFCFYSFSIAQSHKES